MEWMSFDRLCTLYSGYAWVCFQNQYAEGNPWWPPRMCRIWAQVVNKDQWTGWDLESDERLNINWAACRVMILNKPGIS